MPIDADTGKRIAEDRVTDDRITEDRPPFFRSWAGVYGLVLGILGSLIVLFYLFTRHYR